MSIVLYYPSINDSNKFYTILSRGILILQKNDSTVPGINNDIEIALSQLESGCITTVISEKNVLIIKENKMNFFNEIDKIDFEFEHIERPEFPTIAMRIKIQTIKNIRLRYEYFFLTDSQDEINFISLLVKNESIKIYFVSKDYITYKVEKIPKTQTNKLASILLRLNQVS